MLQTSTILSWLGLGHVVNNAFKIKKSVQICSISIIRVPLTKKVAHRKSNIERSISLVRYQLLYCNPQPILRQKDLFQSLVKWNGSIERSDPLHRCIQMLK